MQTNIKKYVGGEIKENVIKFSEDWNGKLTSSGNFFTTIRKAEKFQYYQTRIGEIFNVLLNGIHIYDTILEDASLKKVEQITPELMVLDTGTMDYKKLFEKFHVTDLCVLLLFKKIK